MKIPGRHVAQRTVRWARSRFRGRVAILGYHRVAETNWDPFGLAVKPDDFARQLQVIRSFAYPVRLREVGAGLSGGRLPRRAVVLTFDDGYLDNLVNLAPLLKAADVPATVFVTTGEMGERFWWDELTRIFHPSNTLPSALRIGAEEWQLGGAASAASPAAARGRERFLFSVHAYLLGQSDVERKSTLDDLRNWAGVSAAPGSEVRAMDPSELRSLAECPTVDIGAHTVTHPQLGRLPTDAVSWEIAESRAQVESVLGRRVECFSYPHGSTSSEAEDAVRDAGFLCACAGTPELAGPHSNAFLLPRLWPINLTPERFALWFRWWLAGR
jgi:peptidoglycan/xylan/chitin deacetylase (PgdA/CDA1 family)